jgi:dihydropyrimidinase
LPDRSEAPYDGLAIDPAGDDSGERPGDHMNVDHSRDEGRTVKGLTETVTQRGNILVENGEFLGKEGQGTFLPRSRISV